MRIVSSSLLLGCLAGLSSGPAPQQHAEILIVGTYHMANRGHDLYNVQADDILSPSRQREVAQVLDALKKFHPTKIAIEADIDDSSTAHDYARFLAGGYSLSRSETNQVGYRLAKDLGLKQVYPVNAWAGNDFPISPVIDYAKAHGRGAELDAVLAKWGAAVKELDDYLKTHTVLQTLRHANSDEFVGENMGPYFEVARFGEPADYAGPDLLANYYLRNVRIYHNVASLIGSPRDRILVLYGYGHLGWLRDLARQDPTVRLRALDDFAR